MCTDIRKANNRGEQLQKEKIRSGRTHIEKIVKYKPKDSMM
jgi:hypothetical protein